MTLKLYYHPLSSFCWKALIALYENDTPFEPRLVEFGNEAARATLLALWPVGKIPVLRDTARDRTVPDGNYSDFVFGARFYGTVPPYGPGPGTP